MNQEEACFDDLVLWAGVAAAIRETCFEAGDPVVIDVDSERAIAEALRISLGWWQFALPPDSILATLDSGSKGAVDPGDLHVVRSELWLPPSSPVLVRVGSRWFGAIVQTATRVSGHVAMSVHVVDDADDPNWVPTAPDPAMPVARFAEVFDDALDGSTVGTKRLPTAGRRKLMITNLIKIIHRAGWVLADFPVEPMD